MNHPGRHDTEWPLDTSLGSELDSPQVLSRIGISYVNWTFGLTDVNGLIGIGEDSCMGSASLTS